MTWHVNVHFEVELGWVSEWLLFNAKWAIFPLNHVIQFHGFRFVLDQYTELDFYSASSLNNSLLLHSDTLS